VLCVVGLASVAVISRADTPLAPAQQPAIPGEQASTGLAGDTPGSTTTQPVAADSGGLFETASVAGYLASATGNVTAAVYDAVNGTTSVYRRGVSQTTASIMKVDILATLLDQAQSAAQPLTPADQALSVDMIEQSNNADAQVLWDAEGGAVAVGKFDDEAGLTQTDPDAAGYWGLSTTTAVDQVQLVRTIAYPNSILTQDSRAYALNLMSNVEAGQAWGVSAGVPAGVTVALKNGWLPLASGGWQVNSVGYVDGDGRDYIMAVLTDGNASESDGIATIGAISGLIWDELAPGA
jgi:Beta-lactamase enzyme family